MVGRGVAWGDPGLGKRDGTGWAIEVAEIERMCVVGFPCREEHGEAGYEGREGAFGRGAESYCCCFEKAG